MSDSMQISVLLLFFCSILFGFGIGVVGTCGFIIMMERREKRKRKGK